MVAKYALQILQGFFIVGVGIAGYIWNPEKARSALISGAVFGMLLQNKIN